MIACSLQILNSYIALALASSSQEEDKKSKVPKLVEEFERWWEGWCNTLLHPSLKQCVIIRFYSVQRFKIGIP